MENPYLLMVLLYLITAVFTTAAYIPQRGLLLGRREASLDPKKAARRYLLVKVLGGMLHAAIIAFGVMLIGSLLALIAVTVFS